MALLIGGGLLVLLTVPIIRALGPSASEGGNAAAVGVTFAALVPVAAVLSAVTPTVARLQLKDLRASGTTVGRLSAWATAGALVGTFGTGFVLVPLLPVSTSVLTIGILLVLAGILLGAYVRQLDTAKMVGAGLATLALAGLTIAQHSPCDAETTYHCAQVEVDPERPTAELLLRAEAATVLATFTNVRMITPAGAGGRPAGGNIVLLASNGPLPPQRGPVSDNASVYERAAVLELVGRAEPLRDDYAPVDQLETRPN